MKRLTIAESVERDRGMGTNDLTTGGGGGAGESVARNNGAHEGVTRADTFVVRRARRSIFGQIVFFCVVKRASALFRHNRFKTPVVPSIPMVNKKRAPRFKNDKALPLSGTR